MFFSLFNIVSDLLIIRKFHESWIPNLRFFLPIFLSFEKSKKENKFLKAFFLSFEIQNKCYVIFIEKKSLIQSAKFVKLSDEQVIKVGNISRKNWNCRCDIKLQVKIRFRFRYHTEMFLITMIWTKNYLCNIFFLWLIYQVLTDFALSFSFSRWSLRTLTRNSFLIFHSRETSSWKAWLLWEAAMDTTRQKSNCSRIGHIWHLIMLRVNLTRFVVFIY